MPDFFIDYDDGDTVADKLLEDDFLTKYFIILSKKSSLIFSRYIKYKTPSKQMNIIIGIKQPVP